MKNYLKKHYIPIALGILSILFMWLVWFVAEKTVKNEYVMPSFSNTLSEMGKLFSEGFFWTSLLSTLSKVLYAFIISFLLAGVLSTIERGIKHFNSFLSPIITVVRTLPTMAILVLILIYTDKTTAPVIVAVMVLFPMMYAQFNVALKGIDEGIINATKVFKLTKKQKVFSVYIPLVLPPILSHTGSNLSFAVKLIISAEVMAYAYTSIGGMMQGAAANIEVARLSALTLVAVILGLILELIFYFINLKLFKWRKSEGQND